MGLPTVSKDGTPLLLHMPSPSIYLRETNALVLSYGPFKRAGYKVDWKEGTVDDPHDGGKLHTPDGQRIPLRFEKDLWHLPVFATPGRAARKQVPVTTSNHFGLLTDNVSEPPLHPVPKLWTSADIQTNHEAWCHPGTTKSDAIITTYPDLHPKDPRYRADVRKHKCPVCDLMKGARTYRKSKHMKQKALKKVLMKGQPSRDEELLTAIASQGVPSVCSTHPPQKRVRFAPDTKAVSLLHEDDPLQAIQTEAGHVMHIDHTHSIALGENGGKSYFIFVVYGVEFMWA